MYKWNDKSNNYERQTLFGCLSYFCCFQIIIFCHSSDVMDISKTHNDVYIHAAPTPTFWLNFVATLSNLIFFQLWFHIFEIIQSNLATKQHPCTKLLKSMVWHGSKLRTYWLINFFPCTLHQISMAEWLRHWIVMLKVLSSIYRLGKTFSQ